MRGKSDKPIGIIYPLPPYLINRFFKDNKSVFVKYPTHETISPKLRSCEKLIFYKSRSDWELVGEARIEEVYLMTAQEALCKFKEELFLSEEELEAYVKSRTSKKLLVFKLSEARAYKRPIKLDHYVTMGGEYLFGKDYKKMIVG